MERSQEWLWFSDEELDHRPLAVDTEVSSRSRPVSNRALAEAVRLHLGHASEAALELVAPAIAAGDSDALLLAGQIHFELGRFKEAASDFAQLGQSRPSSRVASFNQGLALARLRHWTPAIDCLRRAAVRDPERFEIWYTLGICLLRERRAEEAAACFGQVLKLRPEYVPGLLGHAAALQLAEEHQQALAVYERLIDSQRERPELFLNAMAAASALNDRKKICELARRLLQAEPRHPTALAALASDAIEQDDLANAVIWYRALAEAEPRTFENWFNLACCYERTGHDEQAAGAFGRALELEPAACDALQARARCLLRLGRQAQAKADWESLLRVARAPEFRSAAAAALAAIATGQGDLAEALRLESEADIADAGILHSLAWCCHRDGQLDEAARLYRKALDIDPDRAGARFNLGLILECEDERQTAREHLATAIRTDPKLAGSYFAMRQESAV
jgi:protein O-GlcNAc transferase